MSLTFGPIVLLCVCVSLTGHGRGVALAMDRSYSKAQSQSSPILSHMTVEKYITAYEAFPAVKTEVDWSVLALCPVPCAHCALPYQPLTGAALCGCAVLDVITFPVLYCISGNFVVKIFVAAVFDTSLKHKRFLYQIITAAIT